MTEIRICIVDVHNWNIKTQKHIDNRKTRGEIVCKIAFNDVHVSMNYYFVWMAEAHNDRLTQQMYPSQHKTFA